MQDTCEDCQFFGKNSCDLKSADPKREKCTDFCRTRKTEQTEKKKAKPNSKMAGVADDGSAFESIVHDGKPAFLTFNGHFHIAEQVIVQGKSIEPKEPEHYPYAPYTFDGNSEIPDRNDLFFKARDEFKFYLDVDSIYLDILAGCTLLSYQQEKLTTVPYIFFYGDNESGKTTGTDVLGALCHRPQYGVTTPSADVYGYLEDDDSIGVILEDEMQGIHKDIDKIKIYKAGYKRGAKVARTVDADTSRRKLKYYNVFCFKACNSEQIPSVKGFRERFIEIQMSEGDPQKAWTDNTDDDRKRFQEKRNELLKWRMATRRNWILPALPELGIKGRLREMWKPLLQVTHELPVYPDLLKFVEVQQDERLKIRQDSLDGQIVKVVAGLYKGDLIPPSDIWDALVTELDGKVDERRPSWMDTLDFQRVSMSRVGYRLREILGGERIPFRQGNATTRAWKFTEQKVVRTAKKYGVAVLPMLPSSREQERGKDMEKSIRDHSETPSQTSLYALQLGNSDNLATNPFDPANIKSILPLDPISRGPCAKCGKNENLVWQAQTFKDETADLCLSCGGDLLKTKKGGLND